MPVSLCCLFLFLPVDDIPNGEDPRIGWQLQCLFNFDELGCCERFGSKGLLDEICVGFRSRGDNLSQSPLISPEGGTARTYNKAGVECLPRPEDELSRTRRREIRDELAKHQVYLSGGDPSFDIIPVLGWVRAVQ